MNRTKKITSLLTICLLVLSGKSASGADEPFDIGQLEEQALKAAVDRVAPSVVRIETVGGLLRDGRLVFSSGPTTGLIVSADGHIISSAAAFARKPTSILVQLPSGRRTTAKLIATDHSRKLVLLKVEAEEKLPVPERFRYIPFLIYEEQEDGSRQDLCTSCGICAKVCPPQCIWIVRTTDPKTKRPIPEPAEFFIDIDICMNCGYCAEYCPFDAIKMDHNYELASYDRTTDHIFNKARLDMPQSYYASIRPTDYAAELIVREAAAAKKAARAEVKRKAVEARVAAKAKGAAAKVDDAKPASESEQSE